MTVVALSGGVGGAKLALGLSRVLPAEELLVVANTGDDFEHLGLSHIARHRHGDVHTGRARQPGTRLGARATRPGRSWRRWRTLGGETWFRLGDRDLAVHVERTRRLRGGETLSAITADLCRRLGVGAARAADERRSGADAGAHRRGLDRFPGLFRAPALRAGGARAGVRTAPRRRARSRISWRRWRDPALKAVVICPSNPFISIEPILAVPGVRDGAGRLRARRSIAVSPIIGGRAIKGPTAKMMGELGHDAQRRRRGAALRRPARRLCRATSPTWTRRPASSAQGHAGADADDDAGGSRGAGAHGAARGAACCGAIDDAPASGRRCR